MGKDPFSAEMAGTKQRSFPVWKLLFGLCLVCLATVLVGFHVPLRSAQAQLAGAFEQERAAHEETRGQLKKTIEQLETTQKERDELAAAVKEVETEKTAASEKAVDLNTQLSEKLAEEIKAKKVDLGRDEAATVITIDQLSLFRGHEVTVHKFGNKILCSVAKALPQDAAVSVEGHMHSDRVSNAILRRTYQSAWELSSALAANTVLALQACGYKGVKLTAAGLANTRPAAEKPRKHSAGEIRLRVSP